ncbi:hypothetical protein ACQP1O_16265 [Nocardia sp. CA-151230]|uniref:hypothetical protein n=1 Tax=Nocardia sp. CA-151230 TaxID=3239982 RepID=UPI003D8B2601
MNVTTRTWHRTGWAATVSTLAAALTVVAVPAVSAEVIHPAAASTGSADAGTFKISGAPQAYFVGSTYNLDAVMGAWNMYETPTISFYDNGKCIGSTQLVATGGEAPRFTTMPWVPTATGTHTLLARTGFNSNQLVVTIQAAPVGSTPDPQPTHEPCQGIGSGSAGF